MTFLGVLFGKSDYFKNRNLTEMFVQNNIIDFGDIPQGKEVKAYFKYQNIGNSTLVIKDTDSRCGCTTANWNNKETKENKMDSLVVYFDAEALGFFSKEIIVFYNSTKGPEKLFITGTVVE